MLKVGSSLRTLDASMPVVFTWAETDPQYLAFKKKNKLRFKLQLKTLHALMQVVFYAG
jgi:hypothetical protein